MELPRSVRWYRERSIIIAIACNEVGQTATKTENILRGDGENTSGLERWKRRGGGGRELARAKPTRALLTLTFARARARARACVYMQTRHMGRRDDRQSGRPLRRKRAERMSRVANRREKTYERKDGPRSRGEGTGVYVPPILITSSYKPTIQRSTATPHRRPP